ncbi:MAG TPA: fasciclin domain-containing protein [Parafilimonas sp.]|nr:fasciclin domain-containing protein [Parafilimonas sp.]
MKSIADVIRTDTHLNTLSRGILAADMTEELSGAGPFTIFAPSDPAFRKLAPGLFPALLKPENKLQLTDLLNHHVIHGKTRFKDLKDGQKLKTINGKELNVTVKDNAVSINGANIQMKDMEGRNGVVHSLDTVIES